MAWSWKEDISTGSLTNDASSNEIKNAVDSIANDLEVSQYNWKEHLVSSGDIISGLEGDVEELRDGTDYIDDWNYCHSEDTDYNITYLSGDEGTIHSGEEGDYFTTNYGTYDGTDNDEDWDSENATYQNSYHSDDQDAEDTEEEFSYDANIRGTYEQALYDYYLGDFRNYYYVDEAECDYHYASYDFQVEAQVYSYERVDN